MTMKKRYTYHTSDPRIYLLIAMVISAVGAAAQTLSVHAPSKVLVGETFRVEYTVNTVDVSGNLQEPAMPEALEVVYGPSVSQQQSYSMVNGHTSSSESITYTFMVMAHRTGTFTIPPAHIAVGGKRLSSASVKVTVGGSAQTSQQSGTRFHQDEDQRPRARQAGAPISQRDLFIRVSANKTRVHEQEPILLTYKVYTLVDLTQLEGKMPDLNGFHSQAVDLPQQKSFHTENVDGRNYRCVTWSQYVMYPQMTGDLEIPPITFRGIVVQENRNVDPFEAFFNGGSGYVEVKREIEAPGLTVHVDPLPTRPADFSGGVGRFNISAQIDKTEVTAGDPINIRVVVGGVGNLKLLKQPELPVPKDFEKYDAKVTDKTKLTSNGVEGNMVYDFITVPRHQGDFTIPPITLTYYDTQANAYKTIKTQEFKVHVEPGDGNAEVSDYTDQKVKDIYPIHEGKASVHAADEFFFGSKRYWAWVVAPLLLFGMLMLIFRRRAIERSNIIKMRGKQANKVAVKRLHTARQLMDGGRNNEFYDEVLRALWGYVGDKMNMPVEKLSRDNVREQLLTRGVTENASERFIEALDVCEYERYAPGDAAGNMRMTYDSAVSAIIQIESDLKSARRRHPHHVPVVLLALLLPLSSMAITKENADAEYKKGNYQQAVKDYEELLHAGVSADVYYNLGNAYYRMDNITRAIINYERALMLSPGDEDIRFNLQLARSKTIDKISPESEMFFVTWYHSIVNSASVDRWAYVAIVSLILALALLMLYFFSATGWQRRVGFYGALLGLIFFVLSNIFAVQQRRQLSERSAAIITSSSASVKKNPKADAAASFVIHEGTKVQITDKSIRDWAAIRLSDGREGWLPLSQMEEI